MEQQILTASAEYAELDAWLRENKLKKVLLVCDSSLQFLNIRKYFEAAQDRTGTEIIKFDDFQPNPLYESVVKGVDLFHRNDCRAIIAVGGGSAMDVAKCIKLYSNMKPDDGTPERNYLRQEIIPNEIPLLAVPTTAGTGSEATRYAVIYFEGAKQSVTDQSIIPGTVLMDSSALKTLPLYQKKSTMMDALCHAVESFWSVNSTPESKEYSSQAIRLILAGMQGYLANEDEANASMLLAANTAGKAINITQTTAGHAMCYKLTSLYGIAHGHAAAMVDVKLFPWMLRNTDRCIDARGEEYLKGTFSRIADVMGCGSPESAAGKMQEIFDKLELKKPEAREEDYKVLKASVNPVRLRNNPVELDGETIDLLYHEILA